MFRPFLDQLRQHAVPVSLREYLGFLEALNTGLARFDPEGFYYLARTTMVKDEKHIDRFDRAFAATFKGLDSITPDSVIDAIDLPAEHTRALFVLHGSIQMGAHTVRAAELAVMEREGTQLAFEIAEDAILLLLNGEPLNDPIVGHGPFVMNSQEEIIQAMHDYNSGKFGQIVQ